ncbi:MAG: SDR family NAD(P)-dependent oxidoreductase, partial [Burkholderiaceae bacterium]
MKDKCVLVTGATKGIGWAVSQRLADMGCHVVGLARQTHDIDFPGYLYTCDLSNAGETEEMLRVIREKYPVDGIVNNVGSLDHAMLGEIDLSQLYNAFDINVRVAVQVTQAFVAAMKARREGRVVNVCGHLGLGSSGHTSYGAA